MSEVQELIPQRPPMVMIGGIEKVEDGELYSWFDIEEDNLFVHEGLFRESGLMENIAQTSAALNGYAARQEGKPVKLGFIGGISRLEVFALPPAGSRIHTRIRELHYVMDTSIIEGEVRSGDRVLARCEMKVFILD